jgi:hypothetical protein
MNKPITALVASVGIALVITAAVKPGTKTRSVVDGLGMAGGRLERASLGESGT